MEESDLTTLKRDALKALVASKGLVASNRTKAELIAILRESNRDGAAPSNTSMEETEFQREVRTRLAFYGPNPAAETVREVMAEATEYLRQKLELEKQKVELEHSRLQAEMEERRPGGAPTNPGAPAAGSHRKIQYAAFRQFVEAEDDIDGFLQDFERQCALQGVDKEDWVQILASRLTGRAADAYRTVPDEDLRDYGRVRAVILARFALTPEAYRLRFRELKKLRTDTHAEWACKLQRAALQWIEGCQADSREDVIQLILLEQFFSGLPVETQDWVRDRRPLAIVDAARLADEYQDARRQQRPPPKVQPRGPTISQDVPRSQQAPVQAAAQPIQQGLPTGIRCYSCQQTGHLRRQCPTTHQPSPRPRVGVPAINRAAVHCYQTEVGQVPGGLTSPEAEETWGVLHEVNPVQAARGDNRQHHRQQVWVNGRAAQGLRDTGATLTLVRNYLVPSRDKTKRTVAVRVAGGAIHRLPTAKVHLNWGAAAGLVEVGLMKDLPADVLLGNDLGQLTSEFSTPLLAETYPVTTRQQARAAEAESHADEVPVREHSPTRFSIARHIPWDTPAEFEREVQDDPSLQVYRRKAEENQGVMEGERFEWQKGLLYRVAEKQHPGTGPSIERRLVVPKRYRQELLRIAHDIPLAGHLGVSHTKHRLTKNFFWPGVSGDVRQYCQTCDSCQRVGKRGDRYKAKLHPLPIVEEPFSRVAVDIIGPLARPSPSGKKYILTVVDYATRYPEAVALPNILAETVAAALLQVFSRVGFPREIISDQGTQFTAEVTNQLWKLCGVKSIRSAPYHPQTNGLCERFNGTLKQLIRTFATTYKNWEKFLPHLLFAYREVPQESTGFSPFELLYGRRVRGLLDLVREHWEGEESIEGVPIVPYVLEFRDRLQELTQAVRENLQAAQRRQRVWYDRQARERTLQIGQKVLVLEPTRQNKFQAAWQGPYRVAGKIADTTYSVTPCDDERVSRMVHVNMLKPYLERPEEVAAICAPASEDLEGFPLPDFLGDRPQPGTGHGVRLGDKLSTQERGQVEVLLQQKQRVFSAEPGCTTIVQHNVETPGQTPLRQHPFRIPESVREGMRQEIQEMLRLGVIEGSNSPWASPVVLVPKKDGSTRFCVDYRKLNEQTVTDAYPMPRTDELLDRMARGRYLTTIDLCKGYWQIPLAPDAIPKSAFITPFGLYQFRVMPFGMKNAPATFQRMVDCLLDGLQDYACAYLDDIAIYSATWDEHLTHIGTVLDRIHGAGLTLNPNKCHIGMAEVQYLGHRVGSGKQRPEPAKIEAVARWPTPRTKTQVMAFLGTAGYYRKFVPNYSSIAKPLTDLTRKNLPRQVVWTPECEEAFRQLKDALTNAPILSAPDPTKRT